MIELLPDLAKFLGLVLSFAAYKWFEKWQAKKEVRKRAVAKIKELDTGVDRNHEIDLILMEILGRIGCDRIHIIQFSNGETSLSGIPFLYMTMTHEKKLTQYASFQKYFQKLPMYPFNDVVKRIRDEVVAFFSIEDKTIMGEMHREFNIACAWKFAIAGMVHNGILSLSWHGDKDIQLSAKQIEGVKIDTKRIEKLLLAK